MTMLQDKKLVKFLQGFKREIFEVTTAEITAAKS